jgi:hypothetical protein
MGRDPGGPWAMGGPWGAHGGPWGAHGEPKGSRGPMGHGGSMGSPWGAMGSPQEPKEPNRSKKISGALNKNKGGVLKKKRALFIFFERSLGSSRQG